MTKSTDNYVIRNFNFLFVSFLNLTGLSFKFFKQKGSDPDPVHLDWIQSNKVRIRKIAKKQSTYSKYSPRLITIFICSDYIVSSFMKKNDSEKKTFFLYSMCTKGKINLTWPCRGRMPYLSRWRGIEPGISGRSWTPSWGPSQSRSWPLWCI